MSTLTIKGGTVVSIDGIPARLAGDTDIETESYDLLRPFSTTPFVEYPKALPDGTIAQNAEHEAALVAAAKPADAPPAAPEQEPVTTDALYASDALDAPPTDPLDDVTLKMDNEKFQPESKSKSSGGAKKK